MLQYKETGQTQRVFTVPATQAARAVDNLSTLTDEYAWPSILPPFCFQLVCSMETNKLALLGSRLGYYTIPSIVALALSCTLTLTHKNIAH